MGVQGVEGSGDRRGWWGPKRGVVGIQGMVGIQGWEGGGGPGVGRWYHGVGVGGVGLDHIPLRLPP